MLFFVPTRTDSEADDSTAADSTEADSRVEDKKTSSGSGSEYDGTSPAHGSKTDLDQKWDGLLDSIKKWFG